MTNKLNKDREQEKVETERLQILIGKRIRKIRKERDLSQNQLAIKMNERDRQVVQRLEQGKTNCSLNLLRVTAKALNIEITDLFIK